MVDPISGMLSICCGVLIILGVISVFLGGIGAILGGTSEAYNRPKQLLNFLYFCSIFLAFYWIMEENGVFESPDKPFETWFAFMGYSSGVLVFHVMNYHWQKLGLGDVPEPPKIRWAIGGIYIWVGMLIPALSSQMEEPVSEGYGALGDWGCGIAVFLFGLAFVLFAVAENLEQISKDLTKASPEAEKDEPPTSERPSRETKGIGNQQ